MPTIPLPVRSNPLPNAPGAVLDRERRPTVDRRGMMAAVGQLAQASQKPLMNGRALAAPMEALASIGESIARTGGVMGALAERRAEAEADVQVMQADNQFTAMLGNFDAWRQSETGRSNPGDWEAQFQRGLDGAKKEILSNPKLSARARERIALNLERRGVQSYAQIQGQASQAIFGKAKDAYLGVMSVATELGDGARYQAARDEALRKGYLPDYEAEHYDQQFARTQERKAKEAKAAAYDAAQNSAITLAEGLGEARALEMIERGALGEFDAADTERLRSVARQTADTRAREAMSGIVDGILTGRIKSADAIKAIDSPHLTPEIRERANDFLRGFDAQKAKIERDTNGVRNAVELRQRVKEYDPAQDSDRKEYFALVQEIGSRVEQSMMGELTGELYRKYGTEPPKMKVRPEIQQNVSRSISALFDAEKGAIPWKTKTKNKEGKAVEQIDEAARARAFDAETRMEMEMADWFAENPGATVEEARKKLNELRPAGAAKIMFEALRPKAPQASAIQLRGFQEADDLAAKLPAGLRAHAQDFIDAGRETGLNPRVLAAIAALETAGGTSSAFRTKRNAMGISDASGPTEQPSVRDSIFRQARTLARADGPYARAQTLDQIARIYAPPGAGNDPKGTNHTWVSGVRSWYARL